MRIFMKQSILIACLVFAFALAGFSVASGQTVTNVKFKRGATNRPYSGTVARKPKRYIVYLQRGSVLFVGSKGNVKYKVRSGGRGFPMAVGEDFASSNYENLENTKFTIEVRSATVRREKFTLYVSATALK